MKIYLVIESVGVGYEYIPSVIHGAFKSKEKAEEVKTKLLEKYVWLGQKLPGVAIFVSEMELQE